MRNRLTWLLVSLGIAALIRRLRRRGETDDAWQSPAPAAGDDPADELRQKLADSRTEDVEASESPPEETVEERRADVHEQGRSAVDEMRDSEQE